MAESQTTKFTFVDTVATRKIFDLKKNLRVICGGTSASKTISILVWIIDYAQTNIGKKIDVISESIPHLDDGAIRDFKNIMIDRDYWEDSRWNSTLRIYTFKSGSIVKFKSVDKLGKSRGPRRNVLFLNEANNIDYEIADQLMVRTDGVVWLDFNPTNEFWYYNEIKDKEIEHDFLRLTYLDCVDVNTKKSVLDENIIARIESHKNNKNWWKVYGLGELGEIETRIYTGWQFIDEIPYEARLERYGLDFGYSNDPTAIVALYYYNGGYILDEKVYQKGLFNKDIADILRNLQRAVVIADSAEPKSIDEIRNYGITILPAKKAKEKFGGIDSYLKWSIGQVQESKISATKTSLNLIKEYRNYLWDKDKNDVILNIPAIGPDHALDAARYAICSLAPSINRAEFINSLPFFKKVNEPRNPAR